MNALLSTQTGHDRKTKAWAAARLIFLYFSPRSSERRFGCVAIVCISAACVAVVQLSVWINTISGQLFTALQDRNIQHFFEALGFLVIAIVLLIGFMLGRLYFQQVFELRWRRWLTALYTDRWADRATFYRMKFLEHGIDNPDQRIAEDIKQLISGTLSLLFGFFQSCISVVSFGLILWTLSGSVEIPIWYDWSSGRQTASLILPGYLVWVAVIYELVATFIAVKIGQSLKGLDNLQQRREADFRYGLVCLREEAEPVAILKGEATERDYASNRFAAIYRNGMRIIIVNARYSCFQYLSSQVTSYLPYIVAGPRYFAGAITLGEFVQINGAFANVEGSLAWFIGAFPTFAEWRATVDRLLEFVAALEACEAFQSKVTANQDSETLSFHADATLRRPDGSLLLKIASATAEIGPREHTAITGVSGSGKSTLLKTLAGLWPYGEGMIGVPAANATLFLPQKPYFPSGVSLQEALWYPQAAPAASDEEAQLLRDLELHHLVPVLDSAASADWCKILSLGEQQRLALIRAFVSKPKWLFMDEPFSALDQDNQRRAAALLNEKLKGTTIIYVGHSLPLGLNIKRHFVLSQQSLIPAPKCPASALVRQI
jgi:putative ATP-binding cassette transporter